MLLKKIEISVIRLKQEARTLEYKDLCNHLKQISQIQKNYNNNNPLNFDHKWHFSRRLASLGQQDLLIILTKLKS